MACGGRPEISLPLNRMLPPVIGARPEIAIRVEVLPAPLDPITAVTSPWGASRSTPRRACTWPYATANPRNSSMCLVRCESGGRAEVCFDDLGIALDLRSAALGDLLPEIEHRDGVGYFHNEIHVVLDDEQCDAGILDLADDARQLLELGRIHTSSGLIQHQQQR